VEQQKQNLSRQLSTFKAGQPISANKLNQAINAINEIFRGNTPQRNASQLKVGPQLYIATETKGKWISGATSANSTVTCRPIRMVQYNEDAVNTDIIGEEITLPKFWDQEIDTDDMGIGVNMGSGRIAFYAIKGGGTTGTCDATIYTGYNLNCGVTLDTDTWERGNPNTTNPTNPSTTNPVEGFQIKLVTRVCYDTTTGELNEIYREFNIDNQGAVKEMSEEKERTIFTAAGCV